MEGITLASRYKAHLFVSRAEKIMGLFKKLADVARANLNNLLGEMEDPKKLAEQAIIDLRESKKKAQSLLVTVAGALKLAEEKLKTLPEQAARLALKAENFLRNNDEISAKEMLREKQDIDHQIKMTEQEIDENRRAKESLRRGIEAIDDKISNLQSSSSVEAGQREIMKEDAFATFARMEEKIESKEFDVAALNELMEGVEKKADSSLAAAKFDEYSDPQELEKELEAIKRKIKE